jgi:hypothetical protein
MWDEKQITPTPVSTFDEGENVIGARIQNMAQQI